MKSKKNEIVAEVAEKEENEGVKTALRFYHPNLKGCGGALKLRLCPAKGDVDGCIMLRMTRQKTVGDLYGPIKTFPTFDWRNSITVSLFFGDLAKMLMVFRGREKSLCGDKGIYHESTHHNTHIVMRWIDEPVKGLSLELYRVSKDNSEEKNSARIVLNDWEALGIQLAIESSMGLICFGRGDDE